LATVKNLFPLKFSLRRVLAKYQLILSNPF